MLNNVLFEIMYVFIFKLFAYYLAPGNCILSLNPTRAYHKNLFYKVNLTTAHEFIDIQDQPQGTAMKSAVFSLLTSTPERTLARTFSALPTDGGIFWSLTLFLCMKLCTRENYAPVGQLFFILFSFSL